MVLVLFLSLILFLLFKSLRLYDVDSSVLRLEAPTEAALFDCCFQNEKVAFTADSDCLLRRFVLNADPVSNFCAWNVDLFNI